MATAQPGPDLKEEPTIGRLIADSTADVSSLIRDEVALAKTELRFSVKAGGIGVALFAVAGFLAVLAIVMLSIAFAYFLDWWIVGTATAFVIVFGVYVLLAAIFGLIGLRKIKQVKVPEQTIAAVKSTKQVLKRG